MVSGCQSDSSTLSTFVSALTRKTSTKDASLCLENIFYNIMGLELEQSPRAYYSFQPTIPADRSPPRCRRSCSSTPSLKTHLTLRNLERPLFPRHHTHVSARVIYVFMF